MTDDVYYRLQQEYGGRYIARRDAEVIASAMSLDDLMRRTASLTIDWADVVIEYVERPDRVRVYAS